jgi:ankyrin repeat protein
MKMLTKETPKEVVQLEFNKLPTCPLTQKKIIHPVLVYTKTPGQSYLRAYLYEYMALVGYIQNLIQTKQPVVAFKTQEPIVELRDYSKTMNSIYDMALFHKIITEAEINAWKEKVKASQQWLENNLKNYIESYAFIRTTQLIAITTPKPDLGLTMPECPLTLEKIAYPVEVLAEVAGTNRYNVYFYEAAAFINYHETLKEQNKPYVMPDTKEPIADFFDSTYLQESIVAIYDAALRHNLITNEEYNAWKYKLKQTQLWLSLHPDRANKQFPELINPTNNNAEDRARLLNTPHYCTDELPLAVVIRYAKLPLPNSLRLEMFDYLESLGADASKANSAGDTLLMVAASYKNLHFFDRLLTRIDPNAQNRTKETVLHKVVGSISDVRSTLHLLKSAIDAGADPTIKNNQGKDALEILASTVLGCNQQSKPHLIDLCDQFFDFLSQKHPHIIFNYATKRNDFPLPLVLLAAGAYGAVKSVILAGYPLHPSVKIDGVVGDLFIHLIRGAAAHKKDFLTLAKLAQLMECFLQISGYPGLKPETRNSVLSVFKNFMIKPPNINLDLEKSIAEKNWLFILNHLRLENSAIENKIAKEIFTQLFQEKERTPLYVLIAGDIASRLYPRCDIKSFTLFESNKMIELSFLKMIIYCNNEVVLPVLLKQQKTPVDIKALADYALSLGHYSLLPYLQPAQAALKPSTETSAPSSASLFYRPTESTQTTPGERPKSPNRK